MSSVARSSCPPAAAGIRVESALAETLVDEIGDEPGGLPLLSTALVELWVAEATAGSGSRLTSGSAASAAQSRAWPRAPTRT